MARVLFGQWNGEKQDRFKAVVEEKFLGLINKDVVINVPHSDTCRPLKNGRFYIHIWSSIPENNRERKIRPPHTIYGIGVDCRDTAFYPMNTGGSIVFFCPEESYAVAELFEDNLYIHHDLCHKGSVAEAEIFRKLLNDVLDKIGPLNLEERTVEEFKKISNSISKSDFLEKICLENDERTNSLVQNLNEKLARLGEGMAKHLKEKEEAWINVERYLTGDLVPKEALEAEFEKLLAIPDVLGVNIEDEKLQIFTSMIRITVEDITYRIGKFRVEIPLVAERDVLRFINLTNKGNGPGANPPRDFDSPANFNWHHPHVTKTGEVCLGNIKEAVGDYICKHQYSVVAILAMQFLKTVNTEDAAGRGIKWWPKEKSV